MLDFRKEEEEGVELGSPVAANAVMYAINWSERARSAVVRGWKVFVPFDLYEAVTLR